ncbi:MAG: hypothetical protein BA863_04975 [Desulfovibrio sp. S3730MH75]|nr:MAG: hypothetical protein BA863_04975 [Desulfovibrio sp. S3730MH75]
MITVAEKNIDLIFDLFIVCYGVFTLNVVLCYLIGLSFLGTVWVSALVVPVAGLLFFRVFSPFESNGRLKGKECVYLSFFLVSAVTFTLCMNRPDPDDAGYLSQAILVLDQLHVPLKELPSNFSQGVSLSCYEYFRSLFTLVTGVPILTSYYLVIPSLIAFFAVLAQWKLLRLLISNKWVVGMFFYILVMLAWGDVHRTHANFGFVRLFQGKAGFVTLIVPALFFYFFKYVQTFKFKYGLLVFFTIVAGVGFTPSGIIVGPLLLLLLGFACLNRLWARKKSFLVVILICTVPIGLGVFLKLYWGDSAALVHTQHGIRAHTTNIEMLKFVVGSSYRGFFALYCFAVSPLLLSCKLLKKEWRNFVLICLLLLGIPWTSEVIAHATYSTASWRWLWIIPFPTTMAIFMAELPDLFSRDNEKVAGRFLFIVLTIIYVASSTRWVISSENYTRLTWPAYKMSKPDQIFLRSYGEIGLVKDGYILIPSTGKMF